MLNKLYKAYGEPHRKYHTFEHILRMFQIAQQRGLALTGAQVFAVWFHDVVYNIPVSGKSNEALSVVTAYEWLFNSNHTIELAHEVANIILATEKVLQPGVPELKDAEWQVVGLDLYDLGTYRYWHNRDLIREEMAHLSDEQWGEARSKFLQVLLDKGTIIGGTFFTDQAESNGWHYIAVGNIERELKQLEEGST